MENESYLIGDLAQKAGVTIRTIRYYISEGLLPSPQVRGRYSVYDDAYLKRIRLIQRLKDAYLPIKEIRRKLETETEEQIEAFLNIYESTPRPGAAALRYIAEIDPDIHFLKQSVINAKQKREPPKVQMVLEPKKEPPRAQFPGTNWRRFVIVNGMELHVRDEVFESQQENISAWIEDFRKRLNRSGKS